MFDPQATVKHLTDAQLATLLKAAADEIYRRAAADPRIDDMASTLSDAVTEYVDLIEQIASGEFDGDGWEDESDYRYEMGRDAA